MTIVVTNFRTNMTILTMMGIMPIPGYGKLFDLKNLQLKKAGEPTMKTKSIRTKDIDQSLPYYFTGSLKVKFHV